ncbi:MAG: metal-dependent hydrolase [Halobacteriaceae archaeon]
MVSTLVHLALGGLVGAALLDRLTPRRLAVVLAATAVPDLDTFLGLAIDGGHRALLHTALLPLAAAAVLAYDLRRGWLRERFGAGAPRVAWAALAATAFAGIAPDLFTNGVNVLYPLHDQFYKINGRLLLSNQRGVVQTFVDLSPPDPAGGGGGGAESGAIGSTDEVHYKTGVDPGKGSEPANVERTFYVLQSGRDLMTVLVGTAVVGARLRLDRGAGD